MKRKRGETTTRPRKARKVGTAGIKKIVKGVLMKTAETKFTHFSEENLPIYHNVKMTTANLMNLLRTTQGVGENQRIGDSVIGKRLTLKFQLFNKLDRPNVTYRIMVISVPSDKAETLLSNTEFFTGESANKLLDPLNTSNIRIIRDRRIKWSGQNTVWCGDVCVKKETSKIVNVSINLKDRFIRYDPQNGYIPKEEKNCLQCYLLTYDAFGTLQTDNIASFAYHARFYYKDF